MALEEHHLSTGRYPETLSGLGNGGGWDRDRWGNGYYYGTFTGNFYLVTYGADGVPGGAGDDEDLVATFGNCPATSERLDSLE